MNVPDTGKSPFVIAIANRKGGTGKTTTAVNLAAGLARRNVSTLLVDLDSQGHAGMAFGLDNMAARPAVHDIFDKGPAALSASIMRFGAGLPDLAPANSQRPHPDTSLSPLILANALATDDIARRYDVAVIDTPPSLDALMVNALAAADAALIPFLPHPLAVEGVRQLARLLFQIRIGENQRLKHILLMPVMANPHLVVQRRMVELLTAEFGHDRMIGSIRSDIRLAEAFGLNMTIFEYAPLGRGAADYEAATDALLTRFDFKRLDKA